MSKTDDETNPLTKSSRSFPQILAVLRIDFWPDARPMKDISALQAFLAQPRQVVITTHSNPDADALGSSLGLSHFLRKIGHRTSVVTPTDYPDFLKWMPGNEEVLIYADETSAQAKELIEKADAIFCLDFSDLKRIGSLGGLVGQSSAIKVLIDHHLNPSPFAQLSLHDVTAAATAEIIYDIILAMGDADKVNANIANCLYAGIMTDTGSFKHSNTTAKVHRTVADLIDKGADAARVNREIYDNNSLNRLRFLGYALNDLLKVNMVKGVAHFVISQKDTQRFNLKSGDTEGLVNYALSIQGIRVAALFKEYPEEIKMSFRSVGDIAVNKFAEDHFSGGGHKNAAGGISKESLDKVLDTFKKLVEENAFGENE
jgi:phosphoesterase RecJ-like protein